MIDDMNKDIENEDELDHKKRGLGRGLSALFDDDDDDEIVAAVMGEQVSGTASIKRSNLGVEQLEPGSFQPRLQFDDSSIDQLAESVAVHGVLQPILVRPKKNEDGKYEIIAGERRWRAAQKAQLHEVPVIIHEMEDQAAMEIGLIENLQREDLNPLDEALGYKRLMEEFDHTQEKLSTVMSKSRSHIANMVRLLNLPDTVQAMVREGSLSAGHARALVTLDDALSVAKKVVSQGLNVRQTEALVLKISEGTKAKNKKSSLSKDPDTVALEEEISNALGMKVSINVKRGGKGSLKIDYKSLDQLDDLLHRLSQSPAQI